MPASVVAALEDDLNTPQALAKLRTLARAANASTDPDRRRALKGQLLAAGQLLGILREDPDTYLKSKVSASFTGTPGDRGRRLSSAMSRPSRPLRPSQATTPPRSSG